MLTSALLGAGANRQVMLRSATARWGLFLPAAHLIGPVLGFGLLGIWIAQIGYRLLLAAVFAVLWRRGARAAIRI